METIQHCEGERCTIINDREIEMIIFSFVHMLHFGAPTRHIIACVLLLVLIISHNGIH